MIRATLVQIVVLFLIVIWLIPAYTMIINGFKTNLEVTTSKALIPPLQLSLASFEAAWSGLGTPILNSIMLIAPVAIISTFLGALGAYYLITLTTNLRRRERYIGNAVFALVALGTFIPYQATIMPLARLMVEANLLGTYGGTLIAYLIFYLPTGALLMSIFLTVVPTRLIEAAKMDGASEFRTFFRVVLPASMPGFIATLIFIFIMSWNVFFLPLVLVTNPNSQVVSVAVDSYTGGFGTLYNESFAAAILASIVPLVLFLFLGRYFIRGLMALGSGGKV
ncbi:MAG: carbohydrate ABC transporter permease [Candidatus Thermoplasmatota archaeon]|nr:carbohydrate ABC transporter permease [Candidatus Thermoplasmatota archaeon]